MRIGRQIELAQDRVHYGVLILDNIFSVSDQIFMLYLSVRCFGEINYLL
jgi:hypothetical protein